MSKFNENISLWLSDGRQTQSFFAFKNDKNQEKAISGLLKRMMIPNRFKYPLARVYVDSELKMCFVQGIEVKKEYQERWYGKGISAFKIKIIFENGEKMAQFYSNGRIEDMKLQFDMLIKQHLTHNCNNNYASAIVMDIRNDNDSIFATIKQNKDKKMLITFCENN